MTSEQRAALGEYADVRRAVGAGYDVIAAELAAGGLRLTAEQVAGHHRQWSRREWRATRRRQAVEGELTEAMAASEPAPEPEPEPRTAVAEADMVRYLAQRLIAAEVAEHGRCRWKYLFSRSLRPGQVCRSVKGRGEAGGVAWIFRAVIFETGGRVDHVEPEARVRRRVRPDSEWGRRRGYSMEMVEVEKLTLAGERLNLEEVAAQQAAMLQLFLGRKCNIKSGAHLGRLTGRTRAAVSHRKLLIAEDYYKATGGRAGFEGTPGARRHREKIQNPKSKIQGAEGEENPKSKVQNPRAEGEENPNPKAQNPNRSQQP